MSSSRRGPRRVLVVDDSALMRAMLREYINGFAGFEVAGEAATGYQAIRLVHELDPHLVSLDLGMPELGGLETLGYIMSQAPRPVIIVSAQTHVLVEPGLSAMLEGAIDFVGKPLGASTRETTAFRQELRRALHAAAMARLLLVPHPRRRTARAAGTAAPATHARRAVAIAASTGGPRALAEIVPRLPRGLPAAVFIAQHMPPHFTAALARRLHESSQVTVQEAVDGETVHEGVVYLAPGGRHLEVERCNGEVVARLSDAEPVWGVRPSADVLFGAVARTFGPASLGVVLTGMGRDGAAGTHALREVGGGTIVQDADSAVIASMPRAAAPFADTVLPLADIAAAIEERVALQAGRAE